MKSGVNNPLTLVPSNNANGKTGTIDNKDVLYTMTFTATAPNTDATLTDTMNSGYVQGYVNGSTSQTGGKIVYNDSFNIQGVAQCDGSSVKTNCYSLDHAPNGSSLPVITLTRVGTQLITITYHGKVQGSLIDDANCLGNNSEICQEKYPNTANSNYSVYDSPDLQNANLVDNGSIQQSAVVQSFCQYILTRASGDIYLETDLNFGKDISQCSQYKSSTGLIVTPGAPPEQTFPSTGQGFTVPIGHEICNTGFNVNLQGTGNETLYGNTVAPNLSSQICEVKLRPGESWSSSNISATIQENKTRVSRWEPNLNNWSHVINSFDSLPASNTGVYHLSNANLTLGSGSDLVLHDGQGAKTFIVENGDLIIKNNIKYGDCNKNEPCTVRDTASLAFIVLNGNVKIDPGVTDVSGVIFVQQGDIAGTGKLLSLNGGDAYTNITFYGSIYGDIQDLFTHRKFAGDPSANQGSVVIRFDERIILNTPPGLTDLLQLNENQVAQ